VAELDNGWLLVAKDFFIFDTNIRWRPSASFLPTIINFLDEWHHVFSQQDLPWT
jgi:hypothetical protein